MKLESQESMKAEKKYELDDTLRKLLTYLNDADDAFGKFMQGGLFWRPRTRDIETFLYLVSDRRSAFWNAVFKKWPELLGKTVSASNKEITIL